MSEENITYVQQEALYQDAVDQARVFVRDFIKDNYPDLDLQQGRVLNDILIEPGATVNAYNNINMDRARRSMSMYEIAKDPTLADEEQVDRVLSNWNIKRNEGTVARGIITIIVSDDSTVSIPEGDAFTANGLFYSSREPVVGTSAALQSPADRPLIPQRDGSYSLSVPVVAVDIGSQYTLRKGQKVTWTTPVSTYVTAFADSDFTGGTDPQSNKELIDELSSGVTSPVLAGRDGITALIADNFPNTLAVSTIGYGDPEMLRDSHNLFGIKTGGKGDIYVKTSAKPEIRTLLKDCFIIDAPNKIFQVSIGREDYPGFYSISGVTPPDSNQYIGSLNIIQEVRGANTEGLPYPAPDMSSIVEFAYTRFQTAIIQFTDPEADLTGKAAGDTMPYNVAILGRPNIAAIQDYCSGRAVRPVQADYLVRAPLPMAVSVELEIQHVLGDKAINVDTAREAVVKTINSLTFNRSVIPTTLVIDAVQDTLEDRAVVSPTVTLLATVRYPSGTKETFRTTSQLELPNVPEESASSRTIGVYTDYDLVSISLKQVDTLSV